MSESTLDLPNVQIRARTPAPPSAWNGSAAVLSACGRYRYLLTRTRDADLNRSPRLAFVMLNPSTADALSDDATIRKCKGFTLRLGFEAFDVVNLYAYRTSSPAELRQLEERGTDVTGGDVAAQFLQRTLRRAARVVVAWGSTRSAGPRSAPRRIQEVLQLAVSTRLELACLALNDDGSPAHPSRLPYVEHSTPWPRGAR